MSDDDYTQDDYYEHIRGLGDDLLDPVASLTEWQRFKQALGRWLADNDAEYDELAQDQEHGREGL